MLYILGGEDTLLIDRLKFSKVETIALYTVSR
jgi:hypothetical protein